MNLPDESYMNTCHHTLYPVEAFDLRADPYRGLCSCGWVTWRAGIESAHFAHAIHVAWVNGYHSDPYCPNHCRYRVRHSQCGCGCDHSEAP